MVCTIPNRMLRYTRYSKQMTDRYNINYWFYGSILIGLADYFLL